MVINQFAIQKAHMNSALLLLPFVIGVFNRWARGEGNVPRFVWYGVMTTTGALLGNPELLSYTGFTWHNALIYPIWLLFLAGYAMAPWQALFSAITGEAPSRKDSWRWQWMQDLAFPLSNRTWSENPPNWYRYGIVYGTIRACLMLPGIAALCWFYQSPAPLVGAGLLIMGFVYYACGRAAVHLNAGGVAVPLAEFTMGDFIGCYMLACAAI